VALVLKSAKREATSVSRCVAISSLAVYIYCQFVHNTKHAKAKEAIAVLLAVLKLIPFASLFLIVSLYPYKNGLMLLIMSSHMISHTVKNCNPTELHLL
jgi:hypothetical protein